MNIDYCTLTTLILAPIMLFWFLYCYYNVKPKLSTKKYVESVETKNWKLLLDTKDIDYYVSKCAKHIDKKFKDKDVVIVGILKGAVYFFVDLTRKLTIPHSCYFIESSSYHDSQQQSECNIMGSIEPSKFKNKYVVLIDELFDNGETMYQVKNAIHVKADVPLDMIFTCTAFKKNKISKYDAPDLFGIEVPNVWLVGYGLDDNQQKRNWLDLWGCPKVEGITQTKDDKMFVDDNFYYEIRNKLITN